MKTIVLAYSGGLDTSIMIAWLKKKYPEYSVIAVTVDIGQKEDLSNVKNKAIKSGASEALVIDAKNVFIEEYLYPLIKSGSLYEGQYILGTISRPLIAKSLVNIANKTNAEYIAHGSTGKGNDQVRFEYTINALSPNIKIICPWRIWDIKSRSQAIEFAKKHNIEIPVTPDSPYSRDQNIWYTSHEGGVLENINNPYPKNLTINSKHVEFAPEKAQIVKIEFLKGIPIKVNDEPLEPITLFETLNKIAGEHGIGVWDIIESRLIGMKVRGVYESPCGAIIYKAHHILETICLDRDTLDLKHSLSQKYSNIVYNGQWFSPSREALDAFFNSTQKNINGSVTLKLYKGNMLLESIESNNSLYKQEFATFEEDEVYDQSDAEGFIKIFSLSAKINGIVNKKK